MAPMAYSTLEIREVSTVQELLQQVALDRAQRRSCSSHAIDHRWNISPELGMLPKAHFNVMGQIEYFFYVSGRVEVFPMPPSCSFLQQNTDFLWVKQTSRNKK